jgi:hypothetical protein
MARMRVMILDHQGKSAAIAEALTGHGCALVDDPERADVILIDHDVPRHGKIQVAERCTAAGGRVFMYPHGGGACLMARWDGLVEPSPLLQGVLASGPGHAEVAARYGYPHPVHDVGWSLCPLEPRRATGRAERVLFAAQHPGGDGKLAPWAQARNREIFERLAATPAKLAVRYLDTLEANGIPRVDGVEYVQGRLGDFAGQIAQIDASDVVVGDQATFATLAVARGVTAVMFDSTLITPAADPTRTTDNLDRYRDYVRFPFDADDRSDIWELINEAARDEERVGEWRARFVGRPLDVEMLLSVLSEVEARDERSSRLHRAAVAAVGRSDAHPAALLLEAAVRTVLDVELLNDLAVVWWNQGRSRDAATLLDACLALEPGFASAAENLALIAPVAV